MYLVVLMHQPDIPAYLVDQLIKYGMLVSAKLVEKFLHSESVVPKVLHVYLSTDLINQIQTGSGHTQPTDSVHVLALLYHHEN